MQIILFETEHWKTSSHVSGVLLFYHYDFQVPGKLVHSCGSNLHCELAKLLCRMSGGVWRSCLELYAERVSFLHSW